MESTLSPSATLSQIYEFFGYVSREAFRKEWGELDESSKTEIRSDLGRRLAVA